MILILSEVRSLLQSAPGVVLVDDPSTQQYPMPMDAHEKDEVFVGRLRRDETQPNTLNMWVVSQIILEKAQLPMRFRSQSTYCKNLL